MKPLRVAVLVDLYLDAEAGGHVKCWQRFAEAAVGLEDLLDLTVFFLGSTPGTESLSPNVRYRRLPPRLGTRALGLNSGAGHTDLAGWHPALAEELRGRLDLNQATSGFAFARTALKLQAQGGAPCLNSLHTDVVRFTRIYAADILRAWLPSEGLQRWVIDGLQVPERASRYLERQLNHLLRQSPHVFAANPEDLAATASLLGAGRVSHLRRGIEPARFSPSLRDRAWLQARFGIAPATTVLLFAGRVDASKRPSLVADIGLSLRAEGLDVQVCIAGEGAERAVLQSRLGPALVAPGVLAQDELARLMASSDVFVFPSETETIGNVAIEAKACGLPVVVAAHGAVRQTVITPGVDGFLVAGDALPAWLDVVRPLVVDPALRAEVSAASLQSAAAWPDWRRVLVEDLVPVWQRWARHPGARVWSRSLRA